MQLCRGWMAWCPWPGVVIDKQLFFCWQEEKFSINCLRCCQTSFLFRNSAAMSEVALGGRTGQWRGGRPTLPGLQNTHRRRNILEHSLAGSRHSGSIC